MNTKIMEDLKREEEELRRAEEELHKAELLHKQHSLQSAHNTSLEMSLDEPPQYTEDWQRRYSLASNMSLPDYGEVAENED